MPFQKKLLALAVAGTLTLGLSACSDDDDDNNGGSTAKNFNRIATFPVCTQLEDNCNTDDETAAEIVAASNDGNLLIYSDSPQEAIGFVDITDPEMPAGDGVLAMPGEPTSVTVLGDYALVAVNTSEDFINVSGSVEVVDLKTKAIITSIDIGGQPDSIAVSPDGQYAAVVLENERDEDLNDGEIPQLPAGSLIIIDTSGDPSTWTTTEVDLTGLADIAPSDPEPEYIDINEDNQAVITLQENNHLVLVDLETATVTADFSAGSVDLTQVDILEEDALITQTESLDAVVREPDGVTWIGTEYFATANEGDMDGGSRGFAVFNTAGEVVYESNSALDHLTASVGQYPDGRSENKGNEPENAEFARFGDKDYLFVISERASVVFVYDVADPSSPSLTQILPAASAPEGGLAIPSRDLLVVASEKDDRGDKLRSALNIYRYEEGEAAFPAIQSEQRQDGVPIPFSALSGLAADPSNPDMLYSIEDSFFLQNRIFGIDISSKPAMVTTEIQISDANDIFAAFPTVALVDPTVDDDDPSRVGVFDEADLDAMINDDKTVNIDPEGIAVASDGGFWVASEGSGTVGDNDRPINSLNFVFKTNADGVIEDVLSLPEAINAKQLRFGFEGVAEYLGSVYVAFQRVWDGDSNVRIGIYNIAGESWTFLQYPLDEPESQNGGWVGLSDLTALDDGSFLVLERDNQGGPDAAIKRIYRFDTNGLNDGDLVSKTLVRDVLPDLTSQNNLAFEKVEGLAVTADGDVWINNDNDGVDDNSGENQLLNLGAIL